MECLKSASGTLVSKTLFLIISNKKKKRKSDSNILQHKTHLVWLVMLTSILGVYSFQCLGFDFPYC
jgi:hypothetical protein